MKQLLPLTVLLFVVHLSKAQPGDFISIRKKGRPYKTFFQGSYIVFRDKGGDWFDSRITDIKHDSLFFREIVVRQVATPWGVPRLDTMTNFMRKVHYSDIIALPKKRESFSFIKNGTIFMIGGAGYLALNVINSAISHYPLFDEENLPNILISTGVFGLGYLMNRLHKNYITIGKKYTVEYIKVKN